MQQQRLAASLEQLVDYLRANRSAGASIADVAAVTEVLLTTMQRYFQSVDTAIYREFRHLLEHISHARTEISQLRPNDLKQQRLPRAGKELEAIVQATEEATGTIMDAAEQIMSYDLSNSPEAQQPVNDACMRIFEACSFQDITGQRITKVVSTLTYIEERLNALEKAWGPGIEDASTDEPGDDDDAAMLNGPALAGEGVDQDAVDHMFADAQPQPAPDPETPQPQSAPEQEIPQPQRQGGAAAERPAKAKGETAAGGKSAAKGKSEAASNGKSAAKAPPKEEQGPSDAQAAIDALFD